MILHGEDRRTIAALAAILLVSAIPAEGSKLRKKAPAKQDNLAEYVRRVRAAAVTTPTTGALWTADSPYTDFGSDYKARRVNDLIVIQIVEQTSAAVNGSVKTQRTFNASSSIGVMGIPGATSGWQNIFTPNSSRALNGQSQTSSDSSLSTSLSGRVVDVLPNGAMIIEAQRDVDVNNQHQTVIIHGVVRPGDVTPSNTVPSTAVSNLQVELEGRGVISDGVEPPNRLVRMVLKLVGF
jgi:flagellar L-ring protein precursor FlgH